jgi:nicotinamide mononucleotide (NMN) deamidase PncC
METKMTTRTLMVAAVLLASGSSLALAQTPPTAGPRAGGVVSTPHGTAYLPSAGRTAPVTRHHNRLYMSTKSPRHRTLATGQPQPKQPQ